MYFRGYPLLKPLNNTNVHEQRVAALVLGKLEGRGNQMRSLKVAALFENLEADVSLDEFIENFPTVSREQAIAVLEHSRGVAAS